MMRRNKTTKAVLDKLVERCLIALEKEKETELSPETKELISFVVTVQSEVTRSRSWFRKLF